MNLHPRNRDTYVNPHLTNVNSMRQYGGCGTIHHRANTTPLLSICPVASFPKNKSPAAIIFVLKTDGGIHQLM